MITRRTFFKTTAAPIVIAGCTFNIKTKASPKYVKPPIKTLLPAGEYRVKIVDVMEQFAKKDGRPIIRLVTEEVQSKQQISMFLDMQTPYAAKKLLRKTGLSDRDMISDNDLMDKELDVYIEKDTFNDHKFNRIQLYD